MEGSEGSLQGSWRGFFIRKGSDRTGGNGHKLKEGKFRLDIKKFFTVGMVGRWNRRLQVPQPLQCSRPDWISPLATMSNGMCPCPWQWWLGLNVL